MITIFPSLFKLHSPTLMTVETVIDRIRNGTEYIRPIIEELRATTDPVQIKRLKESLPVYLWSGEFTQRNAASCTKHSGLICLDFDDEIKSNVINNPYVYLAFNSPTNTGVKAIVRIPPIIEQHERHFRALQEYFNLPTLDNGGDLPRSCFDSYDPEIYINESAQVFIAEEADEVNPNKQQVYFKVTESAEIIRRVVTWLDRRERFGQGNRNKYVHSLCAAFNRFGIPREEAESYVMDFVQSDFSEKEILAIVKSAYGKTADFGTAVFENVRLMNDFRVQKQAGTPDQNLIEQAKIKGLAPVDAMKLVQSLDKGKEVTKFWTIIEKPNDKYAVDFDYLLMYQWLHQQGFYRYRVAPGNVILVKRENNVIHIIEKAHIIDALNDYLKHIIHDDAKNRHVYQAFAARSRSLMHNDQLLFLDYITPDWVQDTADCGYFFYRNNAVKVTKKRIEQIGYPELPGCIWASQIIDRDLKITNDSDCEYSAFLIFVSTGSDKDLTAESEKNFHSICSLTGFLLHNYKDKAKPQAMILTDEVISDFAEGGTGKGIFVRAIGHIKKLVFIDGKNFSFDKTFLWQRVNVDSQVVWLDDVKPDFNFERLFSVLTEGIEVEKKNMNPFFIEFEKSPKFVITTNYTVKGAGNSSMRRRYEIEFKQYFNKDRTPADVFKHNLFDDWDEDEWTKFDNFMFHCLNYYLNNGLIAAENKNLSYKKLLNATNVDWIEWCDLNLKGGDYAKADLHRWFIEANPDYTKVKTNTTTNWAKLYCQYKGWKVTDITAEKIRKIRIVTN